MRQRTRSALVLVAVAGLLVAGCGTRPGPAGAAGGSTATGSATPTPSSPPANATTAPQDSGQVDPTSAPPGDAGGTDPTTEPTTDPATPGTTDAGSGTGPTGPVTDPSGPDLSLYSLPDCSLVPGGSLSGADSLTLYVAVRNGGPGSARAPVPVSFRSDTGLGTTQGFGISQGSSTSAMQVDLRPSDYGRTHRFTIVVDPDNTIVERDESNNTLVIIVPLERRPAQPVAVLPCQVG